MGFFIKGLVSIAVALVFQHVFRLGMKLGYHKTLYYHAPGPCHHVAGIKDGSEDIETLSNGVAIITSGLSYASLPRRDGYVAEGAIYSFDFNDPEAGVTKISAGIKIESPHGLGVWEDPETDVVIVFVVNHASSGELIEKFEYDKSSNKLKHIKSISDPIFYDLNDVVAAGPDTFYTTNHHRSTNPSLQNLEQLLFIHAGSVVYHDGRQGHKVIGGLLTPNGINKSPDGRYLYVASPMEMTISIYTKISDTVFKIRTRYHMDGCPDNIDVAKDNALWVGAHALGHRIGEYLQDPKEESPTQVLRLQLDDGNVTHVEEVYIGDHVSGGTVANYHEGAMLVGTIQTELMYCQVRHLD